MQQPTSRGTYHTNATSRPSPRTGGAHLSHQLATGTSCLVAMVRLWKRSRATTQRWSTTGPTGCLPLTGGESLGARRSATRGPEEGHDTSNQAAGSEVRSGEASLISLDSGRCGIWRVALRGSSISGMSRASIYRRIKLFRIAFGAHPDEFEMPGITLDLDGYRTGWAEWSKNKEKSQP